MEAGVADSDVRFAVLGPVSAYRAGAEIDLGPAKQRAVLGMALLNANRAVSRDEIIDGVWGELVPRSATNLVATYVAGLRRAIEPYRARRSGGTVLTSTGAGYRLRLSPDQLDLEVCERLVATARAADPPSFAAATALDDALALWRGQPLDGLPGPFAAAERQRLTELRLTILEQRVEVGLALGEHADWVSALARMVALHPYRERMRALHMLALCRVGRQAEALGAFEAARRAFADSLGVEPGAELRDLHHRIRAGDPTLDIPPRPASPPARPAVPPAQLPADLADFTGRAAEVATVCGWLDAIAGSPEDRPPVIAVVTGPAGVGKTALTLHAAHRRRALFPDGQLHVDLAGTGPRPLGPDDVLIRLLVDLGVEPARVPVLPDRRAAMLRTKLAGRRLLIVLDDALDATQVRPLLPGSGGCAVLVTSRTRLAQLAGGRCLSLGTLPPGDALSLLARVAGPERVAAEPVATGEVLGACAGLPLAVRIAGMRLADRPGWLVGTLADRLRPARRRLAELRSGDLSVRDSLRLGYAARAADEHPALPARVFRLLGLLDAAEVTVPVAAALAGCPADDADEALERLADVNLVEPREPGRYRVRPLPHLFARELAGAHEPAAATADALGRVVRHYLAGVRRADRSLRPERMIPADGYDDGEPSTARFTTTGEALAWLERELDAILGAGLRAAATPGLDPMLTATLAADLRAFMHRRGHWDQQWRLASAALTAALRDGHDHAAALARLELGAVAFLRRRLVLAEAHLRLSLGLFRRLDDALGLSRALNNLSLVCAERGNLDEAAALVEEDLALLRELGDRFGESVALDNLALVDVRRGRYAAAVTHCVRSVELHGATPVSCAALNLLGQARAGLGQPGRAALCQRRSSQLARRGGNRLWQAQALSDLASAYYRAGRPRRAVASGRQAVVLYRRLGDRYGTATARRRLADAFAALGQRDRRARGRARRSGGRA